MKELWKKSKRLLSILLCLCMVLSMMPMITFAAASTSASTPTIRNTGSDVLYMGNGTPLFIEDGAIVNGGTITVENGASFTNNGTVSNNGTLNTSVQLSGNAVGGNVVRRTAYIPVTGTVSSFSVKVDGTEVAASYDQTADRLYIWAPSGSMQAYVNGQQYIGTHTQGSETCLVTFIPVESVTLSLKETAGFRNGPVYQINAQVTPSDATYRNITYSIVSGDCGNLYDSSSVEFTKGGTVTIRATVENGTAWDQSFTKDYTITVNSSAKLDVAKGTDPDDGDCTTEYACSICGAVLTEAKAAHSFNEDGQCTNDGCIIPCICISVVDAATGNPLANVFLKSTIAAEITKTPLLVRFPKRNLSRSPA